MTQIPANVREQLQKASGGSASRSPFPSPASWSPFFDVKKTVLSNPATGDFYPVCVVDYRRVLLVVLTDQPAVHLYLTSKATSEQGIPPTFDGTNGVGWVIDFNQWGPICGLQFGLDPFDAWTNATVHEVYTRNV